MRRLVILLLMAWLSSIHSEHKTMANGRKHNASCPYHYIKESKSCDEAKRYCKEKYTELANITQDNKIPDCVKDTVKGKSVWLSSHLQDGGKCRSCSKETSTVREDRRSEGGDSNNKLMHFLCYMNDSAPPLILIRENKTWAEALDYCRENYNDLVSVYDPHIQEWAAKKAELADSLYVWLGMRYTCTMGFWFWVGGQQPCYEKWAEGNKTGDCEMSGAMETARGNRWFSLSDAQRLNFICSYDTHEHTDDD